MPFGQLVFGHPGAGKTTYCTGVKEFLSAHGRRVATGVPTECSLRALQTERRAGAGALLPYDCAVDIRDLCDHTTSCRLRGRGWARDGAGPTVSARPLCAAAMRDEQLGPNGAFVFCVEYLAANGDWLRGRLDEAGAD
eukprot:gene2600-21998_t